MTTQMNTRNDLTYLNGVGWVRLDDETQHLLRQQVDQDVITRGVQYDPDQYGCPKAFT